MTSKVAIKTLKKADASMEFLKEALVVSCLKHENIVQFLGITLDIDDCLIFELMEGGQLLHYLRTNGTEISTDQCLNMCFDVVKGCAYLEKMRFIHRDIAARNCLLDSTDPTTMKVCISTTKECNKSLWYYLLHIYWF